MITQKLQVFLSSFNARLNKVISNNKYALFFSLFFSLIYVLPLINANVYYIDDLKRSISGYGWEYDGRHISTFIMSKLTGGGFITDYFPYSTVFAATIVAIAGYILCSIIGLEKKNKIRLSSLILLINPFFLENLTYRWDAIPMSVSILIVILPYLFISSNLRFLLSSTVGIFLVMFIYQASAPIYLLVCLILLIQRCFNGDTKFIKTILLTGASFFLGLVLYKVAIIVKHIDLVGRDSFIFLEDNFLVNLEININRVVDLMKSVFNRYLLALTAISILLVICGYIKFLWSDKPLLCKVLIPIFSVLVLILIPILIICLNMTWYGPRILVTFPFFFYLIFLFINNLSKTLIPYISILYIIVSLALMSSYANALKSQDFLEKNISQKIAQTVDVKNKKIVFVGEIVYAPEVYGAVEKNPLFNYIVRGYLGDGMWDIIYFAKMNSYMYFPPIMGHEDHEEIRQNKESVPIVDENFYYILRADSTKVIVDFDASMSKKVKIETL